MWVYCTGTDSPNIGAIAKNIVLYDFQNSWGANCPQNYLGGYRGYLQVDGYSAYESTQAELAGCMAHARRKFVDAQKVQPKGKTGKADLALNHLQKLYALESRIRLMSLEEKLTQRQIHAVPLLNEFKRWLDQSLLTVLPKSALGTALRIVQISGPS